MDYMIQNAGTFNQFATLKKFRLYVERMSQSGSTPSNTELQATCKALSVNIILHNSKGGGDDI